MVLAMWWYIATGSVCVLGDATKIDIVSSSKLLMKAISQPPATPGTISGSSMRRNTVQPDAPSDCAAWAMLRSKPVAAATTRRST